MQALLRAIYPPRCLGCGAPVADEFALCGACWRDTPFIAGLACDCCGTPLPGQEDGAAHCDDCMRLARPWARGRAAVTYGGKARQLVLQLKHADRLDLARPLGDWMARAAAPLLQPGMVVAPVPLHWLRLLKRRHNQSALLAARVARVTGLRHVPDLLHRTRRTPSQDGQGRAARFENLSGAIRANPGRSAAIKGAHVLLVDDVMTSGATLAACADAVLAAGAANVSTLVFARVIHSADVWASFDQRQGW